MRWQLGNYVLKYNPKTLDKNWTPQQNTIVNANGSISNPNLLFNGTQNFTIDIYDEPTIAVQSSITGSYIGVSEKRANAQMYLLKNNGTFDVKKKDNTLVGTHTIVSGNGVSLPTGYPNSINDYDTGLAFVYPNVSGSSLLLTDENGVSNRKYTYTSDDCKYIEEIAWDYNSNFIALNPYGQIWLINTSNGSESLLFQFDDYSSNKSGSVKRYTSIFMYEKSSSYYVGVLRDKKEIIYVDYVNLDIICKSEIGLNNIIAVSYSNYSDDSFALLSSKVMQVTFNTSRIDVELIKSMASNGQTTVVDEQGFECLLTISQINFTRLPNKNEARYEASINGNIVYTNVGFGNAWVKPSRSI